MCRRAIVLLASLKVGLRACSCSGRELFASEEKKLVMRLLRNSQVLLVDELRA